jgi:hypothetical protein
MTSRTGGRGSVRACIGTSTLLSAGTRLARRIALPKSLRLFRAKDCASVVELIVHVGVTPHSSFVAGFISASGRPPGLIFLTESPPRREPRKTKRTETRGSRGEPSRAGLNVIITIDHRPWSSRSVVSVDIQPANLGSPGPVLQPRVLDGSIDGPLLGLAGRQQVGTPGNPPIRERLRVLIPQGESLGPRAVCDRVQPRVLLTQSRDALPNPSRLAPLFDPGSR